MTENTNEPGQNPPAPSGYEAPSASGYGATPPPPPNYGAAPPPPSTGAGNVTNTMAIVTLVAGIAGLTFVPLIGSIVAVITGPMADKQIAQTGEDGAQLAKIGKILGWVGLILAAVGIIIFILFWVFIAAAASTS